jgi:hypothetical protein
MRSTTVLLSLILSAVVSRADRATFDETKTQIALPLATPPTIDGVVDATEWQRAGGAAGNFWVVRPDPNLDDGIRGGTAGDVASAPASDADQSFTIYAGYDAQNLYIAVRVTDDLLSNDNAEADSANGNTWMDDSVEVFVDGDNSNFETRDTSGTNPAVIGTGGQFVITANNAHREAEAGNPGYGETQAWFARTAPTDDGSGYHAEFRISLAALGNPKPGDIIGFTVGVNDDDDGGGGERQIMWVGSPHTEATYGNLLLGGRSYDAPKTTAPTIDGTINTNEYSAAREIKIERHTAIWDIPSGDDTFEAGDLGFSAWVIHDADAVYVAIDVIDDNVVNDSATPESPDGSTWEDDSVEIFFDADLSRDLGRGSAGFEGQYVFTANGALRDNEANNPTFGASDDWFAATSKTAQGYQVEFRVKKSALSSPADGATLGFHIAQNDDDGAGRSAQPGWSGRAHSEFTYGTLKLTGSAPQGELKINSVRVSGNNLQLGITTPNCAGNHTIQKSAQLGSAAAWSPVTGVTLGSCQGGAVTATFPVPTAREFYRILLQ